MHASMHDSVLPDPRRSSLGSGKSSNSACLTGPPVAPRCWSDRGGLTQSQVRVAWSRPDCRGAPIEEYVLQRATDGVIVCSGKNSVHTETGLAPGTTLRWRVRARNAHGWSDWSESCEETTPLFIHTESMDLSTAASLLGAGLDGANAAFNSMSNSALVQDLDDLQRLQDAGVSVDHRFAEVERRLRSLRDALDDERGTNASARDGLESTLLHLRRELEAQVARREMADGETLGRLDVLAGLLSESQACGPAPVDVLDGLQEVMQSVDELHRRLHRVERHGSMEDLRACLRSTEGALEAQIIDLRAALAARTSEEPGAGHAETRSDFAETLRSDIAALREATRSRHEGLADRVFASEQRAQESLDESKAVLESHCDRLFREVAETQTRELRRSQALWQSEVKAQVQIERSARETWQGALQDRVDKLEQRMLEELHQESELRERDFAELRELLSHEALAREVQHRGAQELLSSERAARESHESSLRSCLASERGSRKANFSELLSGVEERLASLEAGLHGLSRPLQEGAATAAAATAAICEDSEGTERAASAEKAHDSEASPPASPQESLPDHGRSMHGAPPQHGGEGLATAPERVGKDVLCELRQELQQELRQIGLVQQSVEASLGEETAACLTRHASTAERLLDCEVALEELPVKQAGLVKALVLRECVALREDLSQHAGQAQLARKSDRDTYLEFLAREKAAREELLAEHERHRSDTRTRLDILEHLVSAVGAESIVRDLGYNAENALPPGSARLQLTNSRGNSRQPSPSRAPRTMVVPPPAHGPAQLAAAPPGRVARNVSAQLVAAPQAPPLSNAPTARALGAPVVAASGSITPRTPPLALPAPRSGDWLLAAPRVVEWGDDRGAGWFAPAQRIVPELMNSSM